MSTQTIPSIVFRLADQYYSFLSDEVREMVPLTQVAEVPRAPEYIRGVINLRGKVLAVMELRVRLGLEPFEAQLQAIISMMDARAEDHRKWVEELERCAQEGAAFSLNTNPHQCTFGKWYDSYHTDNHSLAAFLKKFDEPHKAIHAAGVTVSQCIERGAREEAQKCVREIKEGSFARMMQLFAGIGPALRESQREIALVIQKDAFSYIAVVDSVESVEVLAEDLDQLPPAVATDRENFV